MLDDFHSERVGVDVPGRVFYLVTHCDCLLQPPSAGYEAAMTQLGTTPLYSVMLGLGLCKQFSVAG